MAETAAQKETVERVMHEFKHGELKGSDGKVVKDRRQAVAIGLSEAGASNQASPAQNRRNRRRTQVSERTGRTGQQEHEGRDAPAHSRSALYAEARKRGIVGRSKMNKAQLERALKD